MDNNENNINSKYLSEIQELSKYYKELYDECIINNKNNKDYSCIEFYNSSLDIELLYYNKKYNITKK